MAQATPNVSRAAAPSALTERPAPVAYDAALGDVAVFDDSQRGRIRLLGRDRAALLQRLTTNDVESLSPGDGTRTVLINHNARILDLLTVYALPEHLLVVSNPGQGPNFARFLGARIFFNDQITVDDTSAETLQWIICGPRAAALLAEQTSVDPHDWPLHHIQAASIGAAAVWLARSMPLAGAAYTLFARREAEDALRSAFAAVPALDAASYDVLRVEQGYPAARHELSTEYIPLETGLHDAVSFSKGCYTGQEIIARMESRNRLAKRLMGLRFDRDGASGALLSDGKEAGLITSTVVSPRLGPIGLGYVRTAYATPGTRLSTADGTQAELVELPFGVAQQAVAGS